MSDIIRSLRVKIFDNDSNPRDAYYVVGSFYNFGYDEANKPIRKKITNIEELLKNNVVSYEIFVSANGEIQKWKDEPKNMFTSVEYLND